ncbi:Aste57867_24985 [Aphanomyces stellatus]|uniref:Aste57867_24985 protein n=1 Tax=Aphanomyces stellatus TaxID=120398 RepID=A0A485LRZ1_9STRA|nr:hypothetical protein As57867_024907 [Aphanomyces stellatus]VFU01616.1 Aste57867_24985 [Aphanomyces stellatus]
MNALEQSADRSIDAVQFEEDVAALVELLGTDLHAIDTLAVPARKRNRKRAEHEIRYLRAQVEDYERQMTLLKAAASSNEPCAWQVRSKRQAFERRVAEEENETLRCMLEQNKKVAEALMKIVRKRPKLADSTYLEDWRTKKLVADSVSRRASFHAMADAKYAQLESVFIQKRLVDLSEVGMHANASYDDVADNIVLDVVIVEHVDYDYMRCADMIWEMYCAPYKTELENATVLETFGKDAMHVKMLLRFEKFHVTVHQRFACKRYFEMDRVVVVFDTILDDELHPYPPGVYVSRETSWLVVSKIGHRQCQYLYYSNSSLPCKSSHDGFTPSDDNIRTMAFAEHTLACYKRSATWIKTHLLGLVAAEDAAAGVSPPRESSMS